MIIEFAAEAVLRTPVMKEAYLYLKWPLKYGMKNS